MKQSRFEATWPDGYRVLWRNLTWAEYKRVQATRDDRFETPMVLAMEVYRICRLEGPDPSIVPAGIAWCVANQQTRDLPFDNQYKNLVAAVEYGRATVHSNFLLAAQGLIASALNLSINEVESWDVDVFFTRLAQAELVLGRPIEPVDPQSAPAVKAQKPTGLDRIRQRMHDRDRTSG